MGTSYELDSYTFESRETYDVAKRELDIINMLRDKVDLTDPKSVLKVYNKFVSEKTFVTIVGYAFLNELRTVLIEAGVASEASLGAIPIRERKASTGDVMPTRPQGESKFKRMYEHQTLVNTKIKIALVAVIVLMIGLVGITMATDKSVFTYFTDYKSNMEEEIINKYEKWEEELQQREDAIRNNQVITPGAIE